MSLPPRRLKRADQEKLAGRDRSRTPPRPRPPRHRRQHRPPDPGSSSSRRKRRTLRRAASPAQAAKREREGAKAVFAPSSPKRRPLPGKPKVVLAVRGPAPWSSWPGAAPTCGTRSTGRPAQMGCRPIAAAPRPAMPAAPAADRRRRRRPSDPPGTTRFPRMAVRKPESPATTRPREAAAQGREQLVMSLLKQSADASRAALKLSRTIEAPRVSRRWPGLRRAPARRSRAARKSYEAASRPTRRT